MWFVNGWEEVEVEKLGIYVCLGKEDNCELFPVALMVFELGRK
jgi:hypothetical protein